MDRIVWIVFGIALGVGGIGCMIGGDLLSVLIFPNIGLIVMLIGAGLVILGLACAVYGFVFYHYKKNNT